jgi:hypothetical protein
MWMGERKLEAEQMKVLTALFQITEFSGSRNTDTKKI